MGRSPTPLSTITGGSQMQECSEHGKVAQIWRRLVKSRSFMLALLVLAAFICTAIFAPVLAPKYGPVPAAAQSNGAFVADSDQGPTVKAMLGRAIHAARVSLLFNMIAASSALLVGISLGLLTGCRGEKLDFAFARLAELVESIPDVLFLIVFTLALRESSFGRAAGGLLAAWAALILVYGFNTARLVRTHIQQIKQAVFVQAARNLGLDERRIFARHILPALLVRILPAGVFQLQAVVVAETVLSYLGLGLLRSASPGAYFPASWGGMLYEGQQVVMEQPLALLVPAACLALLLLALTVLGSRIQRALEA